MKEITLTKAFRIRNLLKLKVCELNETFSYTPKYWDEGAEPDYTASNGLSAEYILEDIVKAQETLELFNISINNANKHAAQEVIIKINSINDTISQLQNAYETIIRVQRKRVIENRITGEQRVIGVIVGLDAPRIKKQIDHYKKVKFDLETELSEINGITKFTLNDSQVTGIEELIGEI
jgi:hypothetical protein